MVTFEFLKQENNLIYYLYYPEGIEKPGIVSISIDGEIWNIERQSEDDCLKNYALHVLSYVYDKVKDGNDIPESGTVAWYQKSAHIVSGENSEMEEEKLEYFVCDDTQDVRPLPPRNEEERRLEEEIMKKVK